VLVRKNIIVAFENRRIGDGEKTGRPIDYRYFIERQAAVSIVDDKRYPR